MSSPTRQQLVSRAAARGLSPATLLQEFATEAGVRPTCDGQSLEEVIEWAIQNGVSPWAITDIIHNSEE